MPATRRFAIDLANDSLRHAIASVVAAALAVVIAVAYALNRSGGRPAGLAAFGLGWLAIFSFTLLYAVGYTIVSVRVFRRLSGSALRARLRAAHRPSRRTRLYSALAGGRSTNLAVQFAVLALLGVLAVALTRQFRSDPVIAGAAVAGVVGSWVLMTTTFACQYAVAWAREDLALPRSTDDLVFGDFFFVAVQLSTAYSTSEADLRTVAIRRTATIHSIVAFGFSTVIVALLVSLVANSAG